MPCPPNLPKSLSYLETLAYNLYWSWDHNSKALFRRLEPDLWEELQRNPVKLLGMIDQERLDKLSQNNGFISYLQRVKTNFENYMERKTWFQQQYSDKKDVTIAYFSMEYGLANGLPIYSGGLGILAGDHLKSASDLGLPLVGIGLLYQQGYFQQYLSRDGWQQETYPINDFYNLPTVLVTDDQGNPLTVDVTYPDGAVTARVWKIHVGRVDLYLLDTNLDTNPAKTREITAQLYGGDNEMRIKQEIMLGIGGMQALRKLGITPTVCHMNEGHSAFLALERVKMLMQENPELSFAQARMATRGSNVFTTHTPVPAGIDMFAPDLVTQYLKPHYKDLGIPDDEFLNLGGVQYQQTDGKFNMAVFAISMASTYNGVSKLHGNIARDMWSYIWPNVLKEEVPIGHITNGMHIRTWVSEDMSELFTRYLGPNWYRNPADKSVWEHVDAIPNEELWRTHERRRERLVAFSRKHLRNQMQNAGASQAEIEEANEVLNPEALTIGFARRFAAYKRAFLLFKDLDRLHDILMNKDCPVQIIIAGKAHPRDKIGKGIIRDIINVIRQDNFRSRIVFLENYNIDIASDLVQGVDVWLNNPRRPREASGTSGMKAGANGALNLSVLDGWWDEGYYMDGKSGWAIGRGETYNDPDEQDRVESEELYHLLEQQVIPAFYERGQNGLPVQWIEMMKNSIKMVGPYFNTYRMVQSYTHDYYLPAMEQYEKINTDQQKPAVELANWCQNIRANWDSVKIISTKKTSSDILMGESLTIEATVDLGKLTPDDVSVEVFYGSVDEQGSIKNGQFKEMTVNGQSKHHHYRTDVPADRTGRQGFTIRVIPVHPLLGNKYEMGLITWH
ncbi:MAG: alpha-glucan family phosphorylase [candidate division KSB1 bacterium]|nr:alpha-glucan family phosphorylase [candidate division KSB1 bacterium]